MTRTWLITGAPRRLPGPPLGWWPPGLGGRTDLPGHNTSRRETEETASTGVGRFVFSCIAIRDSLGPKPDVRCSAVRFTAPDRVARRVGSP
ncbi:hypothetical protein GCM10010502_71040 [Kitasatospora aureofaciens]|uniref:Uncharacterized protein n=1 Tax=Kitasatospora aureofaciens TaxID=1894 RepID=A0A8H9I0V0_KITAU|nr:hypothetical protein GCM10010502_71040 [Kitasatospora aureofaciens]